MFGELLVPRLSRPLGGAEVLVSEDSPDANRTDSREDSDDEKSGVAAGMVTAGTTSGVGANVTRAAHWLDFSAMGWLLIRMHGFRGETVSDCPAAEECSHSAIACRECEDSVRWAPAALVLLMFDVSVMLA